MEAIVVETSYKVTCELKVTVDETELQNTTKPEEYFKSLLQYCLITGSRINSNNFQVTEVTRVERL
jgi:hypothetical protein